MLEHPDRRIKPIVLTMISSGIRVGSWDYLKWKHVIPIEKDGIVVASKLVEKNTKINNRTYYSFLTPEAYHSPKEWMEFRKLHGEEITGKSFLMRDTWQKIDRKHGHTIGLAKFPKQISSMSIRNMIYDAWKIQGIREKLDSGEKRHEFKSIHSFRKMFETKCQNAKMNHNNIKILMDHSQEESIQDDLMHAITPYEEKSNCKIILCSTDYNDSSSFFDLYLNSNPVFER